MLEIRWHGRGGHGIVVASHILGEMVLTKGLYSLSIPLFGAERRGAPVMVVTRIDEKPILKRSTETNPDVVIITDRRLMNMVDVLSGLKEKGLIVINADRIDDELAKYFKGFKVSHVDAVSISEKHGLKVGGLPVISIPLLGAFIKATNIVDIEDGMNALRRHWGGELGEKNAIVFKEAYQKTNVVDLT